MRTPEQERFEGMPRAIGRRVSLNLLSCVGATLLVAFGFVQVVGDLVRLVPGDWPPWAGYLAIMVPGLAAMGFLPTGVQWFTLGRKGRLMVEAINGWAIPDALHHTRNTGRKPPRIGGRGGAERWLSSGQGQGTRTQARALMWVGRLDEAADAINALPAEEASDAFHRELLMAQLGYVATGSMDLAAARSALAEIPHGTDRVAAQLALAFEEARLIHARGGPWQDVLANARAQVTELPAGASVRDRWLASVPSTIGFLAVIGAGAWFLSQVIWS